MIDFLVIVQVLLLLITIALMIAIVLFFRKPTTLASLSTESRALWLLVSLGFVFVTASIFELSLGGWKDDYRKEKGDNKRQLQLQVNRNESEFAGQVFQPLGKEYQQLQVSLDDLDKMNIKISKLLKQHKNHTPLLKAMLATFTEEKELQSLLYKKVRIQIRNAMIQSANTQNPQSVQSQFYGHAQLLHKKMVKARKRASRKQGDIAGLLADSLKEARRSLHNKLPRAGKKMRKIRKMDSFSNQTSQILLRYLGKQDPESLVYTKKMIKQINAARQNRDKMLVLSQHEKDLQIPLSKTMQLWSSVEEQGQKYWGSLLYSLEALYIANQFDMPKQKPAYYYLMRDLKGVIPTQLERLVQLHHEAESSFISPDFVDKKGK